MGDSGAFQHARQMLRGIDRKTVADKEYLEGFASRRQRRVERAVELAPDPDHLAVGEDEADVFPRVEHAAQRNGSVRRSGRARVGPVESDRSAGRQRHRGRRPAPQGLRVGFHRRRNAVGRPVTAAVHRKEGNRLFPNAPRRGALEAELQHPSGGRRHRLGVIAGFNARFQVGFHLVGRAEQVDRLLPGDLLGDGHDGRFRTAVCDRQRRGALLRQRIRLRGDSDLRTPRAFRRNGFQPLVVAHDRPMPRRRDAQLQGRFPGLEIQRSRNRIESDIGISVVVLAGRAAGGGRKQGENQQVKKKFLHKFIRSVIISTNEANPLRNRKCNFTEMKHGPRNRSGE